MIVIVARSEKSDGAIVEKMEIATNGFVVLSKSGKGPPHEFNTLKIVGENSKAQYTEICRDSQEYRILKTLE